MMRYAALCCILPDRREREGWKEAPSAPRLPAQIPVPGEGGQQALASAISTWGAKLTSSSVMRHRRLTCRKSPGGGRGMKVPRVVTVALLSMLGSTSNTYRPYPKVRRVLTCECRSGGGWRLSGAGRLPDKGARGRRLRQISSNPGLGAFTLPYAPPPPNTDLPIPPLGHPAGSSNHPGKEHGPSFLSTRTRFRWLGQRDI